MSMTNKRLPQSEYLDRDEFISNYPRRKNLLAGSPLEKHVSWVLVERVTSKTMTYFLMSATGYIRACESVSSKPHQSAALQAASERERKVAIERDELRVERDALQAEVSELRHLHSIEQSLLSDDQALQNEKGAVNIILGDLQRLLESTRNQNPNFATRIAGNIERILDRVPNKNAREYSSFFDGQRQRAQGNQRTNPSPTRAPKMPSKK